MTKYILHGGNSREISPDNDGFFREMTLGSEGKTLVLLNYFAREKSEIEELAKQDRQRFLDNAENKNLEFEIATPELLPGQIKRAYVMYIRGGRSKQIKDKFSSVPDLKRLFDNRVIGGSSAGVYVLTKYYFENDTEEIGEGLGIFNFKAFCHYTPERKDVLKKLTEYKENLPLFVLPNHKWVVFYR